MNLSNTFKRFGLVASMGLCTLGVNGQAINESFEDISTLAASGWVMNNLSTIAATADLPDWTSSTGFTTPPAAQAGVDYIVASYLNTDDGAGIETLSNWLITPSRTFNNGDVVTFYSRTVDVPAYADRLEVRLSVNGTSTNVGATPTSVGDFTTLLMTINSGLTLAGYPSTWTQYTINVAGLPTPMTGRLAFRYFVTDGGPAGTNSDFIGIDNFVYTPAGAGSPDMEVTTDLGEYTSIPLSQVSAMSLGATVTNVGTADATNVVLTAKVFMAPNFTTPVQTTTSSSTSVNTGANAALTASTYTPSMVGTYVYQYIVSSTGDVNAVNDTMEYTFIVDNNMYARDNGSITNTLGVGINNTATLGNKYTVANAVNMDSVLFFMAPGADGLGDTTRVVIYSMAAGLPSVMIGKSAFIVFTAADTPAVGKTFVINVANMTGGTLALTPGDYFVGLEEFYTSENYALGMSGSIFKTNTTFANISGGAWSPIEALGFPLTAIVRPFVSVTCPALTSTATTTSNYNGADVSCMGSADGMVMASATGGSTYTYMWSNAQTNATATGLAAGMHYVTITDVLSSCMIVDSVMLTEPTLLTVTPASVVSPINCNGGSDGEVTTMASGGTPTYTYMWGANAGNQTTMMASGLAAGTYTVSVTDANNCMMMSSVTLTEPTALVAAATDNGNGTATASATGGTGVVSYMWDASTGNQTTATATGLMSATYSVTVTDANGCESVATVVVTVVGVNNIASLNSLKLFPNPTTANVFVDLDLIQNEDVAIRIVNVTGQVVLQQNLGTVQNTRVELETSNLPTGIYMVHFVVGNETATHKLTINK